MISLYVYSTAAIFVYMFIFFVAAMVKRNNSIVDLGWGGGFAVIAVLSLCLSEYWSPRQLAVDALVMIWAVRLSLHLYFRNNGKEEDYRYAAMRQSWGNKVAVNSFIRIFMLQGFVMLLLAYPIIFIHSFRGPDWGFLDSAGAAVWVIGFLFETVSDLQLYKFSKIKSKGSILQTGLWRYTRHPNYFGESFLWLGIAIMACSVPWGWSTLFSPALLAFLLLKVSGIPLLEKKYADNPQYIEYAGKTSKFLPWFPKKANNVIK